MAAFLKTLWAKIKSWWDKETDAVPAPQEVVPEDIVVEPPKPIIAKPIIEKLKKKIRKPRAK